MSHVDLSLTCRKSEGDCDREVLVRWQVGLVVRRIKQPIVNDAAHDATGRLAGSAGARGKTNSDGHLCRASQGVLNAARE